MARNEFEFGVYSRKDFWPRRSDSIRGWFRIHFWPRNGWGPRGTRKSPQWRPITLLGGDFPLGFRTTSSILTKDLGAWDLEFPVYWRSLWSLKAFKGGDLRGGTVVVVARPLATGERCSQVSSRKHQSHQAKGRQRCARLLCQRETLMGTSTSIVRRKKRREKTTKKDSQNPRKYSHKQHESKARVCTSLSYAQMHKPRANAKNCMHMRA